VALAALITWPFIQDPDEIAELVQRVKSLTPRFLLEIGTYLGGTLKLWCEAAADDATIISIDLPGGEYGGGYPEIMVPVYHTLARGNQRLELIREDSHKPRTLNQVRRILRSHQLDFLFIDGDHTYEGVKEDYVDYSPLVREGGLIALHDITRQSDPTVKVSEFWSELKGTEKTQEIVKDWTSMGIGLVIK
jgi:predicted O-methyltransferase YrrM